MYCPAQPHAPPQARARGPDAPGSPADVVAFVHALQFYSLSAACCSFNRRRGLAVAVALPQRQGSRRRRRRLFATARRAHGQGFECRNFPQVAAAAASQASVQEQQEQQEQAESAAAPKPVK